MHHRTIMSKRRAAYPDPDTYPDVLVREEPDEEEDEDDDEEDDDDNEDNGEGYSE
jgi:hypothetical protein